jgi:phosphate transport system ATP-binding protein
MIDLQPNTRVDGQILLNGDDLYAPGVDVVDVRRRIGMVFQRPNPFPKSIYENIAYGLRRKGVSRRDLDGRVEQALRKAALWDEVKDKLKNSGLSLSGGQQQRLCIARAVATEPSVLLMDEPCSALDPIATRRIEELMVQLKQNYTIAIVTHNMQQAQRVADVTAFFSVDISKGNRTGYLVESGPTKQVFESPREQLTKDYVSGQFS